MMCGTYNKPIKVILRHDDVNLYHHQIDKLREEKWLNIDVLALLRVSGILYNPSINRFLRFECIIEQKPGGSWKNNYNFEQLRVDNLVTPQDRIYVTLHSLCTVYVLLILNEQRNWFKDRIELGHSKQSNYVKYFTSVNMVLGGIIVILQISSSMLRLVFFFSSERLNFSIVTKSQPTFSFANLYSTITIIDALVVSFAWVRITKYMEASQLVYFMSEVMSEVSQRSVPYLVIFLSVIAAFNIFACITFGTTSANFSSWNRSFITLCQMVFDRIEMEEAEMFFPYAAPAFLFTYYLIVVLVLRNIFIAIFIDGYRAAAERYELKPPELVQWTFKGILGAIISSFQPKDMIHPNDPVSHLKEIGVNMGKKLKRVDIRSIKDLAVLTDRDISIATSKTVFISADKFKEFRAAAIVVVEAFEMEQKKDARLEQNAEAQQLEQGGDKMDKIFDSSGDDDGVEMTKTNKK
eukprot:g3828.t1